MKTLTTATIHPIARRMAQRMTELATTFGSCSESDLQRSFSRADIRRHGDAARDLAAQMTTTRDLVAA